MGKSLRKQEWRTEAVSGRGGDGGKAGMGGKQWSIDVWRSGSCSLKAFTPTVSVSKYTFLPVFSYLQTATQSQYLLSLCATGSGTFYLQGERPFSWSLKRVKECIGSVIHRPCDNKFTRRIVTSITRTHHAMRTWQFRLPCQALMHPVLHGVTAELSAYFSPLPVICLSHRYKPSRARTVYFSFSLYGSAQCLSHGFASLN